jgi:hypothetical protein
MNLGSGIRDPEKTYSGSRIQGSKRQRIPDPEHCSWIRIRHYLYGSGSRSGSFHHCAKSEGTLISTVLYFKK